MSEHAWRQGSDNWSSTGSSRPSSATQPPSCSTSCSTPDTANFQQLSLTGRRAAFRTQKWSHSFDQSCLAASPGVLNRRQQHQPLSLDSGYPGSPSSGLASYQSQTWTETTTAPTAPTIEVARRELAGLMKDNNLSLQAGSGSLPSFPDIFQTASSCLQSSNFYPYPASNEGVGTQEDLDELDKEITEIVEQATASGGVLREMSEENICLKPRPIRSLEVRQSSSPGSVMVAVVSTAEHAFTKSPGEREEQEDNFYSSSVTSVTSVRTSSNLYPPNTGSARASPDSPLVVRSPPICTANQPAGFKRTSQFSSESSEPHLCCLEHFRNTHHALFAVTRT